VFSLYQIRASHIHKKKNRLEDFKKWSPSIKANLFYRDGKLEYTYVKEPILQHPQEARKILEKRKIYDLWINGVKESNKLVDDGRKEIDEFESIIHNALKDSSLKESLSVNTLAEPSYAGPMVRKSIYEGIICPDDLNLEIKDNFLNDGAKKIAEGDSDEPKKIQDLKSSIDNLIKDNTLREKIRNFNEIKKNLEKEEPLKDFYIKRDELIREYEDNKENFFHRNN